MTFLSAMGSSCLMATGIPCQLPRHTSEKNPVLPSALAPPANRLTHLIRSSRVHSRKVMTHYQSATGEYCCTYIRNCGFGITTDTTESLTISDVRLDV